MGVPNGWGWLLGGVATLAIGAFVGWMLARMAQREREDEP